METNSVRGHREKVPISALHTWALETLPVQGVRRQRHLRARKETLRVQGVRWRRHLRARKDILPVQGVRRRRHLRARKETLRVQGVPANTCSV